MENPAEVEPLMVDPRGEDDGGTVVPPLVGPSAQPDTVAQKWVPRRPWCYQRAWGVVGGGEEGEKIKGEAVVGGDFDGDVGGGGLESRSEVPVERVEEEIVEGIPVEEAPMEETPVIPRRSGEPKGKGIAIKESVITPGPVGLTASDYAMFARQEDVMERA